MPVIQFNDRDLLRGKVLTPSWYRVRIEEVSEKSSKDGGSTNYPVEAIVIKNADNGEVGSVENPIAGIPLDWMFNSKAIGFAVGFLQSLGFNPGPGQRIDLAAAAGKEIEVFVENDTYQGRIVNRVNHKYRPAQ